MIDAAAPISLPISASDMGKAAKSESIFRIVMRHPNTFSHQLQYANAFDGKKTQAYRLPSMLLLLLLMQKHGDNAYDLEKRSGVPQPTINRILSGLHKDPRSSTVKKLAAAYGITEGQLRGDVPLKGMDLPEPSNVRAAHNRPAIPIISWVAAGHLAEIVDYWADDLGSVTASHSKPNGRAFALIVEGYSMTDYTPGARSFPPGTRLIVDPDMGCGPNDYVIAKDTKTQQATFKQLVTDGGRWYLRPQYFGCLTNDIVYERLAPGLLDEMKKQSAKDEKKSHLHRRLTQEVGHPKLREHLASVIMAMKLSPDYATFISNLNRVHPRYGQSYALELEILDR